MNKEQLMDDFINNNQKREVVESEIARLGQEYNQSINSLREQGLRIIGRMDLLGEQLQAMGVDDDELNEYAASKAQEATPEPAAVIPMGAPFHEELEASDPISEPVKGKTINMDQKRDLMNRVAKVRDFRRKQ